MNKNLKAKLYINNCYRNKHINIKYHFIKNIIRMTYNKILFHNAKKKKFFKLNILFNSFIGL